MFSMLLASALIQPTPVIDRDPYGVPKITAPTLELAFVGMGMASAQDRLWQMEMSRRVARGEMAEIMGASAVASDRQTLQLSYTDAELQAQIDELPKEAQTAFAGYAVGVNRVIAQRTAAGTLPAGYKQYGFEPRPWTTLDSAAIAVNLLRRFGTGGAGEIRTLALMEYLKSQKSKDRMLDVLDDLGWQNDPRSIPTVSDKEDPLAKTHMVFTEPTRAQSEAHLAKLPKVSILELLPAVSLSTQEEQKLVAEKVSVASKWGSYAIVVTKSRSATGNPLLLTAPQMGHSTPSVIHETAIDCPELKVQGIDIPGVPTIVIGSTPNFCWGLTTGTADIEDTFFNDLVSDTDYKYGRGERSFEAVPFERKIKGGDTLKVVQERTNFGPVILKSRSAKTVLSRKSSLWKKELTAIGSLFHAQKATTSKEILASLTDCRPCFNFFYATTSGDAGWRLVGKFPLRAPDLDPRFPTPGNPANDWRGDLAFDLMPHVDNPKSGLIVNWNNKPASWWPNLDTPVWGRIFRNEVLLDAIPAGPLRRSDLEKAAWTIARKDTVTNGAFADAFKAALKYKNEWPEAAAQMYSYDGWHLDGSASPVIYNEAVKQLRKEIFSEHIGNLTSDSLFEQGVQPSVILNALEKKTKFPYLGKRTPNDVLLAAFRKAVNNITAVQGQEPALWRFTPGSITVPGQPKIPYIARGTYIQINEVGKTISSMSVASPGVEEEGPHSVDQAFLARAWTFKPVWPFQK